MLGVLTQQQLAHSLFPLGDTPKPEIRAEAARRGLLVAEKPDSHDICFVADGDNAGWLREKLGDRAPNHGGAIVDAASGEELGTPRRHRTASPSASAAGCASACRRPTGSRGSCSTSSRSSGTVTVGSARRADRRPDRRRPAALVRRRPHVADAPGPCSCAPTAPRTVPRSRVVGDRVEIELLDPAQGIAPGQAAVLYDGTRVVGSATIVSTARADVTA